MQTFQTTLEVLVELYRLASIGRLMNGLIHNLNGPLHSLGIETDVMTHLVLRQGEADPHQLVENIRARLARMDDEFEHLNRLIRMTAARADPAEFCSSHTVLNDFLCQELEFAKGNLYFKHNVKTTLELDESLPVLRNVSEAFHLGLAWLIQGLAEEMEKGGAKELLVVTSGSGSDVQIRLALLNHEFSKEAMDFLTIIPNSDGSFHIEGSSIGLLLGVLLLKSNGMSIEVSSSPSRSDLILSFPLE